MIERTPMLQLPYAQVAAWRLSQQHLSDRADNAQWLDVVSQIGGLHAQMMSAAELALWARISDATPTMASDALWRERTLIKSWFWRGTLHLISRHDYALVVAALSTLKHFERGSWQRYHGITLEELQVMLDSVRDLLTDRGMTREALADALAARTSMPKLGDLLRSGWGALLKPASFRGLLCYGEDEGRNVTFVSPRAWLGEWDAIDPQAALPEVAWRYFSTYGPSTAEDFARWVGLDDSAARKIVKALADRLVEVDVDGSRAWVVDVIATLITTMRPVQGARLLPHFDPYIVALPRADQARLTPQDKARIYRPQGWISPVLLMNGEIAGVWGYEQKRERIIVTIEPFGTLDDDAHGYIDDETRRLGDFLGGEVSIISL
jgi:hypothetical protein